MADFLEKLKKGMGSADFPQEKDESAFAKATADKEKTEKTAKSKTAKASSRKKTAPKKAREEKIEVVKPSDLNFVEKKDEVLDKVFPSQVKEALAEELDEPEEPEEPEEKEEEETEEEAGEIETEKEEAPKPVFYAAADKEPVSVFAKENIENGKKGWFEQEGQLTVDVFETDREIVVRSAIAGVKPEDLDISIENEVLLIKGKREEHKEEKVKDYYYQECYWGKFSREIVLPEEVDSTKVEAVMKDGILIIKIPKLKKGKKISISEQ